MPWEQLQNLQDSKFPLWWLSSEDLPGQGYENE